MQVGAGADPDDQRGSQARRGPLGAFRKPDLILDSCITQLKAQGSSRTCNESKEEVQEEDKRGEAPSVRFKIPNPKPDTRNPDPKPET